MADEISEKVVQARETEESINENRNKYRAVAARGAMLFFLLNSLNKIHAFYQYSLNAFVTVFARAIDVAPGDCSIPHSSQLTEHAPFSVLFPGWRQCQMHARLQLSVLASCNATQASRLTAGSMAIVGELTGSNPCVIHTLKTVDVFPWAVLDLPSM